MANILLRLRVNDLVRCRRVSKFWLSVIDDPHFISRRQLQLSISTNSNAALLLQKEERVGDKVKAYGFGYDESSDDYNSNRDWSLQVLSPCRNLQRQVQGFL
ncbi:hypothetical protein LINPERHAP2_LOCUS24006 [Linum perenne]